MHKLTNKFRKLLLSAVTIGTVGLLAGCGVSASGVEADNSGVTESQSEANGSGQNYAGSDSQKLQIVATIFPEYDWTRNILGNREADVNLTMLLDNGTDLHSFQPAVKDIMKVSSCDLLIYVGGESDQWIEDALESAQNKDMKTINLMEVLGDTIKEEETVEGMQDSEHEHGHEDEHAHEGEDEKEYECFCDL